MFRLTPTAVDGSSQLLPAELEAETGAEFWADLLRMRGMVYVAKSGCLFRRPTLAEFLGQGEHAESEEQGAESSLTGSFFLHSSCMANWFLW